MAEMKSGEFEQAMERLEAIVAQLEKGDTSLDESVRLFREGRALAKRCDELLEGAQEAIDGTEAQTSPAGRPGALPL